MMTLLRWNSARNDIIHSILIPVNPGDDDYWWYWWSIMIFCYYSMTERWRLRKKSIPEGSIWRNHVLEEHSIQSDDSVAMLRWHLNVWPGICIGMLLMIIPVYSVFIWLLLPSNVMTDWCWCRYYDYWPCDLLTFCHCLYVGVMTCLMEENLICWEAPLWRYCCRVTDNFVDMTVLLIVDTRLFSCDQNCSAMTLLLLFVTEIVVPSRWYGRKNSFNLQIIDTVVVVVAVPDEGWSTCCCCCSVVDVRCLVRLDWFGGSHLYTLHVHTCCHTHTPYTPRTHIRTLHTLPAHAHGSAHAYAIWFMWRRRRRCQAL